MSLLGGESWPVHEPLVPMRYGSSTGFVSSPVCGACSCLKIDSSGDPRVAVRSRPRGATRHRPASPSLGLGMLDPLPPGPGRMTPVSNSRRLALMTRPYPRVGRPGSWPRWTSRSTHGPSERPSPGHSNALLTAAAMSASAAEQARASRAWQHYPQSIWLRDRGSLVESVTP